MDLYKLVVRDCNGKVKQIHEIYTTDIGPYVEAECLKGYSVTVTKLK
jgi:hypothetical protein